MLGEDESEDEDEGVGGSGREWKGRKSMGMMI